MDIVFDPVVLPWMSDQDVELGSRSMAELGETLDRSSFGIIVVTRTNQNSQWINFEAGALSKKVGNPAMSVVPVLVDFDSPTDLTGPLAQFQAIIYQREQLLRMMLVIAGRAGVSQRAVQHRFDTHWTTFDDKVQSALKNYPAEASVPERDTEDKTDEMLAILRRLQSEQRGARSGQHAGRLSKDMPSKGMGSRPPDYFIVELEGDDTRLVSAADYRSEGDLFIFTSASGIDVGSFFSEEVLSIQRAWASGRQT